MCHEDVKGRHAALVRGTIDARTSYAKARMCKRTQLGNINVNVHTRGNCEKRSRVSTENFFAGHNKKKSI